MKNKDITVDLEVIQVTTEPKALINEQAAPIGYETSNQLHLLECIKKEAGLSRAHNPHIAWQLIHNTSAALATEYPTLVHFAIAREALVSEDIKGIDRRSKEYKDIVIQVASLLNEYCQKLKIYLSPPKQLKETFDRVKYSVDTQIGSISVLDLTDWSEVIPSIDSCFEDKQAFFVDTKYLEFLKKIGKESKTIADGLSILFDQHYASFKRTGQYPLSFWFNLTTTPEKPIFFAHAWISLAKAIWRDEVSRRASLIIAGVPTIIENDQKHIMDMVSHDKKIEQTDSQIQIFSHGLLLGEIPIPMIPDGAISNILKGVDKMRLVEGHRVLRYVVRTAFNQAINGSADPRVIRRESPRDIASELGLKGERSISGMMEVFQAMAYLNFKRPSFSGNLIALTRFKSAKTHRLDGVEITVGTNLLPYRACEDFKSGESNLMIPLLSDPLLVGSNQYHAGQYLLQMLVMREFVKQSVDFAKYGHVKITQDSWQKMAEECGVLPILKKILDRWTQDGQDGPKFLEENDNNFYALGPSYQREADFLIRQGNLRISQSNRGKAAATKRIQAKE